MTSRSWVSINICWMNGLGLNSLAVWFPGPPPGLGHLPACQAHLAPSVMGTTPPRLQGHWALTWAWPFLEGCHRWSLEGALGHGGAQGWKVGSRRV